MKYFFRLLILGDNELSISFLTSALKRQPENKETYLEWMLEYKIIEDICDIEIIFPDLISANFDELIPSVDGVIYFINPLDEAELELFDMLLAIIDKVKREIPTIIVFNGIDGILSLNVNDLLDYIWFNYPDLEVFANIPPSKFYQLLHCLTYSMINGSPPINLENSWLRLPVLVDNVNTYYRENKYYEAAKSLEKVAFIYEVLGKHDYYIVSEQAATLYSRMNLFLEASRVLKDIDKKKLVEYKERYVQVILREANREFNNNNYELAAKQYENAAQWASIELNSKDLVVQLFKLAVNSWISACKCDSAYKVFDRLPHNEVRVILTEIASKTLSAINYLVSIGNLEGAKDQLYYVIDTYQREGLFELLEAFTTRMEALLILIFEEQINNNNKAYAKRIFEEIENIWVTFKIPRTNLDSLLKKVIILYLDSLDFNNASNLMNSLNSLDIKRELTSYSSNIEEKNKEILKFESQLEKKIAFYDFFEFIEIEHETVANLNKEKIMEADSALTNGDYNQASLILSKQVNFLNNIGKYKVRDVLLKKQLNILLEGEIFNEFIKNFYSLSDENKKKVLITLNKKIFNSLQSFGLNNEYSYVKSLYEKFIGLYRDQLLYNSSQSISYDFINIAKKKALQLFDQNKDISTINNALDIIKDIEKINSSYIGRQAINFDEIYEQIAHCFLEFSDISSALKYSDKITKQIYRKQIHQEISKIETERSNLFSQELKLSLKEFDLSARLFKVKNKSRDALLDKQKDVKQRKALKRAIFKDAFSFLKHRQYNKAVVAYREITQKLVTLNNYNMAGVSLAITCLLYLLNKSYSEIHEFIDKIENSLGELRQIFNETFSVALIKIIIDSFELNEEEIANESLPLLKSLPLYEEELQFVKDFYLTEFSQDVEKIIKEGIEQVSEVLSEEEINLRLSEIENEFTFERHDIAKRKLMKDNYWAKSLKFLEKNDFENAASAYLEAFRELIKKGHPTQYPIGLILATLTLAKEKSLKIVKSIIEGEIESNFEYTQIIQNIPEIKLIRCIYSILEQRNLTSISRLIDMLLKKAFLFEQEKQFLENFISKEQKEIYENIQQKAEEPQVSKQILLAIEQNLSKIQQKLRDIIDDDIILRKRKAMKRRYYQEPFSLLKGDQFEKAGEKYLELANSFFNRKDTLTGALMLLFYGLVLIKTDTDIEQIKLDVENKISNLSANRNIIEDIIFIMLLHLIIDIKLYNLKDHDKDVEEILKNIPILEEERVLIDIF